VNDAEHAFRRHYGQVLRYLRRRTGADEAEDLTQAVFADAAERLPSLRPGQPPVLAWLYTVAQRRLADGARRAARRPVTIAELDAERVAAAEPSEYGPDVTRALGDAIAALPRGQRDVVVMKLLEGRSFAEIARRAGASEGACKMRFARGLEALREALEREGIGP
jgi:RNA polymerase sigma factor (sigma-70 family)